MNQLLINKISKKAWKSLYGAYRAYKNNQKQYELAWEAWIDSNYQSELEDPVNLYSKKASTSHDKWLDALDLVYDATSAKGELGLQPHLLCRYAFEKDQLAPFSATEKLRARLYIYKEKKYSAEYNVYIGADDEHSFFREYNIGLKIEESLRLTDSEKTVLGIYHFQSYDIDYGLSAFQFIDLEQRNEYGYGWLGQHWRGYEKKRHLP